MSIPFRLANGPGNPPDARKFMANYDWLTAMAFGNRIINGGFEDWTLSTSYSNPANATDITEGWTWAKSGTSAPTADVSREATNKVSGSYAVKVNITGAGSSNSRLLLSQIIEDPKPFLGLTILVGVYCKAATGSKVRVKVTDGTTTQYSSYHTGGNTFEHLQVVLTVASNATVITASVEITSDFTGAVYIDNASAWSVPAEISAEAKAALTYVLESAVPDHAKILNALDYGVTGDGTTDDAAAINALFASASDGDLIFFPPNLTYMFGTDIVLPGADNVTIMGYGATFKMLAGSDCDLFVSANYPSTGGGDFVKMYGFTIDGNKSNNTGKGSTAFYGVHHGIMRDVYIHDAEGVGFFLIGCNDWRIESCRAYNNTASGFCAYNGCNRVHWVDCYADANSPNFLLQGLEVDGQSESTDLHILGGYAINAGLGQDGVQVFIGVHNWSIVGLQIRGNAGKGINVYSTVNGATVTSPPPNTNGIITGCDITDNEIDGIKIWDDGTAGAGSNHISVYGNRIYDNGSGDQDYGVTLQNQTDYVFVTNNDVTGNVIAGVLVGGGVNGNGLVWHNPGYSNTLPVAMGGTGVTTSTGSGANVLNDSPTIAGTPIFSGDAIRSSNASGSLRFKYITLANDATAQLCNSAAPSAIAFVVSDQYGAIFSLRNGFNGVLLMAGAATEWSDTATTAGKTNIYWSAGNSRYEIENKTGGSRQYCVCYVQQG